ncbi:MAG TPA: hypothetical protein VGY96_09355 [Streptosporangiaceae bacterium]|jgi:hypothetical protein|nr:hypothetical protein [Streptosporangiaceae bacterium]
MGVFEDLGAEQERLEAILGGLDAASAIYGPAGAFCRVAARRLAPQDSGLTVTGPQGAVAVRLLRTYAE